MVYIAVEVVFMQQNESKLNKFSVGLGLFDYINPIFYAITASTIIINMKPLMNTKLFVLFVVGACISMIFGLTIPTVKLLVGLGKMQFKMPVNLVFYVNTGLLLSGMALIAYTYSINAIVFFTILITILALLALILYKTRKFNTVAVLIGAAGYVLLYVSLITLSFRSKIYTPIILFAIAIILFVLLCLIGINSNLKKAKVHWVIETCNVLTQGLVALGTILLFKH